MQSCLGTFLTLSSWAEEGSSSFPGSPSGTRERGAGPQGRSQVSGRQPSTSAGHVHALQAPAVLIQRALGSHSALALYWLATSVHVLNSLHLGFLLQSI